MDPGRAPYGHLRRNPCHDYHVVMTWVLVARLKAALSNYLGRVRRRVRLQEVQLPLPLPMGDGIVQMLLDERQQERDRRP